jgi:hypothetical protein
MTPSSSEASPDPRGWPQSEWSQARWPRQASERPRRARWTPIEIVAMVLGFIVFWPIGLAILAWNVMRRRPAETAELRAFADERIDEMRTMFKTRCGAHRQGWAAARWGAMGDAAPAEATGNRAFDEWRAAELTRIAEERRKLETAQREFAEYQAHLRQARDREEFDRFVAEREAAQSRGEAGWRPFPDAPRS